MNNPMTFRNLASASLILAGSLMGSAQAAVVSITDFYNTGVDANGDEVTTLNAPDPHYKLGSTGGVGAYVKTSGWFGNDTADSQWIWGRTNFSGGTFNFYTTFTIDAGADLDTVLMSYRFGHDESATIYLNGTAMAGFGSWGPGNLINWDASSNTTFRNTLLEGSNELRFRVTGSSSIPNGMRIYDITSSYDDGQPDASVPVPAPLLMLASGLALLRLRTSRLPN